MSTKLRALSYAPYVFLVVQKADKYNSVVLIDCDIYFNYMKNILKERTKFEN